MNEAEALLSQLRDLHVPSVSAWPAIGWWLLAVVLALAALWLWRRHRRRRYEYWRQEALMEIERLRQALPESSPERVLADCSVLARRLLLVAAPRTDIASLHGEAWLQRLDEACREPTFSRGAGRLLLDYPYRPNVCLPIEDLRALLDTLERLTLAVRAWRSSGGGASRA